MMLNFEIEKIRKKCDEELFISDLHFSFKYLLLIAFVFEISPK